MPASAGGVRLHMAGTPRTSRADVARRQEFGPAMAGVAKYRPWWWRLETCPGIGQSDVVSWCRRRRLRRGACPGIRCDVWKYQRRGNGGSAEALFLDLTAHRWQPKRVGLPLHRRRGRGCRRRALLSRRTKPELPGRAAAVAPWRAAL